MSYTTTPRTLEGWNPNEVEVQLQVLLGPAHARRWEMFMVYTPGAPFPVFTTAVEWRVFAIPRKSGATFTIIANYTPEPAPATWRRDLAGGFYQQPAEKLPPWWKFWKQPWHWSVVVYLVAFVSGNVFGAATKDWRWFIAAWSMFVGQQLGFQWGLWLIRRNQ